MSLAVPAPVEGDQAAIVARGEAHKALVRRVFDDVFNRGDLAAVDELVVLDVVMHSPTLPEPSRGPDGIKQFAAGLRAGFPDLQIVVEDLIVEGDRVAARWRTSRQTHTGPYLGVPPTGRQVTMTGIDIFRIVAPEDRADDGRVGEIWLEIDAMGGMQQMGVVPALGIGPLGFTRFFLRTLLRFALAELRAGLRRPRAG